MAVQTSHVEWSRASRFRAALPTISPQDVGACASLLKEGPFAIWLGFGARHASESIRELVERSGAKAFCSPRAKGILPEDHPQFLGVTGLGGHEAIGEFMLLQQPKRVLVLGTRLGEATSFWDPDLQPTGGFIHVDLDPDVPGTAYPDCQTIGIHAEIGHFVEALIPHFPANPPKKVVHLPRASRKHLLETQQEGLIRPQLLMQALQQHVIDASDALILSECGNAFAWCNHYLRFPCPGRYRVSTLWGSMGHCAAGVVGAALARSGKAVAVVGDGSMLMNSEISTAVQYQAEAIWVVLNDSGYGMCRDGHTALGLALEETGFHRRVDFAGLARAMGAGGRIVISESDLDAAFEEAMSQSGPYVLDVHIDPDQSSPLLERFESLIKQGNSKNVAGWEA